MNKKLNSIVVLLLIAVLVVISVTSIYAETIYYYFGYLYTYINNDTVSLYGLEEGVTALKVPADIDNHPLVEIRNYAFMDNSELTSINFSNASNLNRIGSYAFNNCVSLNGSIVIPNSVSDIGNAAFRMSGISAIAVDCASDAIPIQFCYKCTELSNVTLGSNIKSIGDYAFAGCDKLQYLEIPATVESISGVAFYNDNITLGVYTDSYAHQYAVDNNIPFILLDAPEPPTEPPTQAPTVEPTQPATEAPTVEPTQSATEKPTESTGFILGDVDNNGVVSISDVTLIQRSLVNLDIPASCVISQGDVDNNGITGSSDAAFIMRYLINLTTGYPIGEIVTR